MGSSLGKCAPLSTSWGKESDAHATYPADTTEGFDRIWCWFSECCDGLCREQFELLYSEAIKLMWSCSEMLEMGLWGLYNRRGSDINHSEALPSTGC